MDDWVPLLAVEGSARLLGATTDVEAREAALAVLAELATAGLIQIGEVSDGGFFEWEASTDDALARVRSIREATDRNHWGFCGVALQHSSRRRGG